MGDVGGDVDINKTVKIKHILTNIIKNTNLKLQIKLNKTVYSILLQRRRIVLSFDVL